MDACWWESPGHYLVANSEQDDYTVSHRDLKK